jgi:hypothetical protein
MSNQLPESASIPVGLVVEDVNCGSAAFQGKSGTESCLSSSFPEVLGR